MKHRLLVLVAAAVASPLLASCGSSNSSGGTPQASTASITAPASIKSAGKLVFCSDISFPPEEFYQGTTPIGSDIEIGTEIAKRMGVTAEFDNTGFDGIIAALLGRKCDAIISGMNDTPDREKQVLFANYLNVGLSIMVPKGNPKAINGPPDLCGKTAGGQIGSTAYIYLQGQTKVCTDSGKTAITVVGYKEDTDGANGLATNKVDAYLTDSPVIAYYISQNPAAFQFGGTGSINAGPVGIAVRPDEQDLRDALNKAIHSMYTDGGIKTILKKWNLQDFVLTT